MVFHLPADSLPQFRFGHGGKGDSPDMDARIGNGQIHLSWSKADFPVKSLNGFGDEGRILSLLSVRDFLDPQIGEKWPFGGRLETD